MVNQNRAANLLRSKLYVCPVCGNVLHATGQAVVSCCGITLPAQDIAEAEDADEHHQLTVERVEDELFVTIHHPMTKDHFISFIAYLTGDKLQLVRLYPEGDATARFPLRGTGVLYFYCNPSWPDESPGFPHCHPAHRTPEDSPAGTGRGRQSTGDGLPGGVSGHRLPDGRHLRAGPATPISTPGWPTSAP